MRCLLDELGAAITQRKLSIAQNSSLELELLQLIEHSKTAFFHAKKKQELAVYKPSLGFYPITETEPQAPAVSRPVIQKPGNPSLNQLGLPFSLQASPLLPSKMLIDPNPLMQIRSSRRVSPPSPTSKGIAKSRTYGDGGSIADIHPRAVRSDFTKRELYQGVVPSQNRSSDETPDDFKHLPLVKTKSTGPKTPPLLPRVLALRLVEVMRESAADSASPKVQSDLKPGTSDVTPLIDRSSRRSESHRNTPNVKLNSRLLSSHSHQDQLRHKYKTDGSLSVDGLKKFNFEEHIGLLPGERKDGHNQRKFHSLFKIEPISEEPETLKDWPREFDSNYSRKGENLMSLGPKIDQLVQEQSANASPDRPVDGAIRPCFKKIGHPTWVQPIQPSQTGDHDKVGHTDPFKNSHRLNSGPDEVWDSEMIEVDHLPEEPGQKESCDRQLDLPSKHTQPSLNLTKRGQQEEKSLAQQKQLECIHFGGFESIDPIAPQHPIKHLEKEFLSSPGLLDSMVSLDRSLDNRSNQRVLQDDGGFGSACDPFDLNSQQDEADSQEFHSAVEYTDADSQDGFEIADSSLTGVGLISWKHTDTLKKLSVLVTNTEPLLNLINKFSQTEKPRGFNPRISKGRVLLSNEWFIIRVESADLNRQEGLDSSSGRQETAVIYTISVQNVSKRKIEYLVVQPEADGNLAAVILDDAQISDFATGSVIEIQTLFRVVRIPYEMPKINFKISYIDDDMPHNKQYHVAFPVFYHSFFRFLKFSHSNEFRYNWDMKAIYCRRRVSNIFIGKFELVKDEHHLSMFLPGVIFLEKKEYKSRMVVRGATTLHSLNLYQYGAMLKEASDEHILLRLNIDNTNAMFLECITDSKTQNADNRVDFLINHLVYVLSEDSVAFPSKSAVQTQ